MLACKQHILQIYVLDESQTAKNTKYFEPVLNSYMSGLKLMLLPVMSVLKLQDLLRDLRILIIDCSGIVYYVGSVLDTVQYLGKRTVLNPCHDIALPYLAVLIDNVYIASVIIGIDALIKHL